MFNPEEGLAMRRYPLLPATLAAASLVTLAACNRTADERTVGQQVDSTVTSVEKKTEQAATEVKKEMTEARDAVGQAMDATADKVKDATITTTINAELARDATLSALKIDVDTRGGRVLLKGTAPDAPSRERATLLAQGVEGVVSVDNQLEIRS
jgi:hyperosmotically inducible periplasmic protein